MLANFQLLLGRLPHMRFPRFEVKPERQPVLCSVRFSASTKRRPRRLRHRIGIGTLKYGASEPRAGAENVVQVSESPALSPCSSFPDLIDFLAFQLPMPRYDVMAAHDISLIMPRFAVVSNFLRAMSPVTGGRCLGSRLTDLPLQVPEDISGQVHLLLSLRCCAYTSIILRKQL